jgi:hypothetical protein
MRLLLIIDECHPIFSPLAREPRGQQFPLIPHELHSLVKDKVHAQDTALRAQLETLQWNIEDESVLRLVYGDKPLEQVRNLCFEPLVFCFDVLVPISMFFSFPRLCWNKR